MKMCVYERARQGVEVLLERHSCGCLNMVLVNCQHAASSNNKRMIATALHCTLLPFHHACSCTACSIHTCVGCVVEHLEHAMVAAAPHKANLVSRASCGEGRVGDVAGWDHPRVDFKQRGSCSVLQRQAAYCCMAAFSKAHKASMS